MLKATWVNLLVIDLVSIGKNNTIDKVGNSNIVGVKVGAKMAKSKSKSKGKNLVKFFLAKSQSFVQSSELSFITLKAR